MKLSLLLVLALTIVRCSANDHILCQHYDEEIKCLQIFCDQNRHQFPQNCTKEAPSSLNPSNVIHLKVEQCDENLLRETSEKYQNVQRLDISFSKYPSLNWSAITFNSVNELDVSFNGLTTIPVEMLKKFPKILSLDISNNQLMNISTGDFQNVPKMIKINLSYNYLDSIDENAFVNLPNLKSLNLRNNRFKSLPVLNKLSAIEIDLQENSRLSTFNCTLASTLRPPSSWLNLTWYYITSFHGDQGCKKRKILDIKVRDRDGVHLTPTGLELTLANDQNLKNIITFVAGDRSFIDVKQMFAFLGPSVRKMDLSGNNVYELNRTVFEQFPNLQELNLSDTALKVFDFESLNVNVQFQLIRLDISENKLKNVKNTELLPKFENLIDLNAAGNEIQNAHEIIRKPPPMIKRLNLAGSHVGAVYAFDTFGKANKTLEYLNLSDTHLSIFDVNPLLTLDRLQTLDLSHNNLNGVVFAIRSKDLKEFRVANSNVTNVSEIFENLNSSMQTLDLSGNNIGSIINLTSIQTLGNLKHLNLSGTHLKFNLDELIPLKELHTLDISNNQLQWINLKALKNFTQLKRIYLNGNDLTNLDSIALNASPDVSFAISKNQFSCMYLKQLKRDSPNLKYIDNQLDQKHGEDCLSSSQAIGDFLSSVYDKVKFW